MSVDKDTAGLVDVNGLQRAPWRAWTITQWQVYRGIQLEAVDRLKAAGQATGTIEQNIRLADWYLRKLAA